MKTSMVGRRPCDAAGARKRAVKADMEHARWVHVARLPLTVTAADVRLALAGVVPGKGAPTGVSSANGGGQGGGAYSPTITSYKSAFDFFRFIVVHHHQ